MVKFYNELVEEAKKIRYEVFVEEQGFNVEIDEIDDIATHCVLYENNIGIGVCRFFNILHPQHFHLGRFAIKKEYRKNNKGKTLLLEVINKIKSLNGKEIHISAQQDAIGFYQKCGFIITSETYYEQHCPHKDMILKI